MQQRVTVERGVRARLRAILRSAGLLLLIGVSPPSPAGDEALAERIARAIEDAREPGAEGDAGLALDALMETHATPALSIAVVRDHEIVFARAWGVADPETGRAADVDTLFQAASISKPVSAMAVLTAVQEGAFGLDDDINSILESWQLRREREHLEDTPVTPRMLLSMTAGTTVPGFPGYLPTDPLPTPQQVLGARGSAGRTPANTDPVVVGWTPGTREEYSGGGSTILQVALTDALDTPFPDILAERVLTPIGMADSCFCQPLPEALHDRAARATGATVRQDGYVGLGDAPWHVYPELFAAGLWTTPTDLARFMIEVQRSLDGASNRVLDVEHTRRMVRHGGVGAYGLGFTVGSESPHRPVAPGEAPRYFGHTGGNWGFRANFEGRLEGGDGFVIMANSDEANPIVFRELPARLRAVLEADRD